MMNYNGIQCVLVDIDGTLANLTHRLHYIQGNNKSKDYESFFNSMINDEPIIPIIKLVQEILNGQQFRVIYVSGRPDSHRHLTEKWLAKYFLSGHTDMYMRKAGDYRPDNIVKKEILNLIKADGYNPILVLDDRQRVVDMWREEGLTCLQVAPGNFDETSKGQPFKKDEVSITLMVGPSGAGKTSWIADNIDSFIKFSGILSPDEMRRYFCGSIKDQSRNSEVFSTIHNLARNRLANGLPIIIDATNLHRKSRLTFVKMAPKGTKVRYVIIDRPLEIKLRDGGWRLDVIVKKTGLNLIKSHHDRFKYVINDVIEGDDQPNVIVSDCRVL